MSLSACSGKTSYTSWTLADRAARGLRRKVSAHCQAYRCPSGCGWHLGNYVGVPDADRRSKRRVLAKIEKREARAW